MVGYHHEGYSMRIWECEFSGEDHSLGLKPRPRDAGEREGPSTPQTPLRLTTRLTKLRDEIFN